jgi:hypothetical protein
MLQYIILIAILAGTLFFAVRYFKRTFSGKGSCCSGCHTNCPMKDTKIEDIKHG